MRHQRDPNTLLNVSVPHSIISSLVYSILLSRRKMERGLHNTTEIYRRNRLHPNGNETFLFFVLRNS